jgi:hypothetical protein
MITVIPTRRVRRVRYVHLGPGALALAVAIVAVLCAVYLAFEVPLGDEAIAQFASDPAAREALAAKESS